jgi:hypothetical protein
VERTAAVFTSLSDARGPLDAKIPARAFRQGAKAEHAIARVLASLARLGHIYTADGRDYSLRRRARSEYKNIIIVYNNLRQEHFSQLQKNEPKQLK